MRDDDAKARDNSGVAGTVALSGTLCAEAMLARCGDRSRAFWQPALAWALKDSFVARDVAKLARRGVVARALEPVDSVTAFDSALVVPCVSRAAARRRCFCRILRVSCRSFLL